MTPGDALGDLVRRTDGPGDAPALVAAGDPGRSYDADRLRATARRTGNFLGHLGVHEGATVGAAGDPTPEALLAFLGTALLGGVTWFEPPRQLDARVVVAPAARVGAYDLPPGGQRVAYGADPGDPAVHRFERDVWSENRAFPERRVDPDAPAVTTGEASVSRGDLVAAARRVAADLGPGDRVALRASLARPGTVAAAVVAPLFAGAAVLLPGASATGTVAVVDRAGDSAPEPAVVAADAVGGL